MDEMTVKALAKINIGLDVTGMREDGYHLVRMIMQTVHMYDLVTVSKSAETGISMTSNAKYLPTNEDNLCIKAAKLLADEFSITDGTQIRLSKRIPVAAAWLEAVQMRRRFIWYEPVHGLGLTKKELMERGVKIGADVHYCLMRGTALAEGIGEELTELPQMMRCPVLIAKPPISVSTKYVYEHLERSEDPVHPDIDAMIADIQRETCMRWDPIWAIS